MSNGFSTFGNAHIASSLQEILEKQNEMEEELKVIAGI